MKTEDLSFMIGFMNDSMQQSGMTETKKDLLFNLWNNQKLTDVKSGCSILELDFGKLGSVIIQEIESVDEDIKLKYKSGSYDYISAKLKSRRVILWTDHENIEPYNRQGGLYADGSSFRFLGSPVESYKSHRVFDAKTDNMFASSSFAVWGFQYNDYWKTLKFGICIENDKVDSFISELRSILEI